MIIYGSRNKEVAQQHSSHSCSHCNTPNATTLHVIQRYFHIFWIPMFPFGKIGASQCNHCKQVLPTKQMPSSLRSEYDQLKADAKTPLWMFLGLALLGALIVSIAIDEKKENEATAAHITHLQPNDLLKVKTDEGYTYLKVVTVKGDTISLRSNKQIAVTQSGVSRLGVADHDFIEDEFETTQGVLVSQYKKGTILKVSRHVD